MTVDQFNYFVWFILISLITVFLLLLGGILWHGISRLIIEKKRVAARSKIHTLLIQEVKNPNTADIKLLKPFAGRVVLLNELEAFSRRFHEKKWNHVKQGIAAEFLLPKARLIAESKSWMERNFAARCFALSPLRSDLNSILKLIDDPVFLVRCRAAEAIIELRDKKAIYKLIQHMSDEPGYAHYYFRDLLLQLESFEVLEWIEDFGLHTEKRFTKIACLDLLSAKNYLMITSFLKKSLASEDHLIRYQAIKVHARNPQKESKEVLIKHLKDTRSMIREEAAYGLQFHYGEDVVLALKEALEDPSWKVKIGAARSLKKHGKLGLDILASLDPNTNPQAVAASEYAGLFE